MPLRLLLVALTGCWVSDAELVDALDRDGDGHLPVEAGGDDCDETDPAVHPGAMELCGDAVDNDCDGNVDDNGVGATLWYADDDADGFGRELSAIRACSAPPGHVDRFGDCEDTDPALHPDADDVCNGIDDDCDGRIDEDEQPIVQFVDADGDGYGVFEQLVTACELLAFHSLVAGDCDDGDPDVHEGAPDNDCDDVDDDCDGLVDEDAPRFDYYVDLDGDAWGDAFSTATSSCLPLPGQVTVTGDCDDGNPDLNPAAVDSCNGIDDDCDGAIDEDAPVTLYYLDLDGDGAGGGDGFESCGDLDGAVLVSGDCRDDDPTIRPGINDLCDGIDQDCDGLVDEDADVGIWYLDEDGDNWGVTSDGVLSCQALEGRVEDAGDCNDTDPTLHPGVPDLCDGEDQDCDGAIDEDGTFTLWYPDDDGDLWGRTADALVACAVPPGHVANGGDCEDADGNVHPGVLDVCDARDEDCDGAVDEDATFVFVYPDVDGDGLGDATGGFATCAPPPDTVTEPGDCDDTRASITILSWNPDLDGDGHGGLPAVPACDQPANHLYNDASDCDDTDGFVNPRAPEVCGNGIDDDCDPSTDCLWSGSISGSADRVLVPPSGWTLDLLHDIEEDEGFAELVATTPTDTRLWLDATAAPNLVAPPDATFPVDCTLASVRYDGQGALVCSRPGELRLYQGDLSTPRFTVTSTELGFGSRWATAPSEPLVWVASERSVYRFQEVEGSLTDSARSDVFDTTADSMAALSSPLGPLLAVASGSEIAWYLDQLDPVSPTLTEVVPSGTMGVESIRLAGQAPAIGVFGSTTSPYLQGFARFVGPDTVDALDGPTAQGFPNEAVQPRASADIDGDGGADWVFATTGAYARTGIATRTADALSTDVAAWFLEPGGAGLELVLIDDLDHLGAADLAFRRSDGALLFYHRERE